MGSRPLVLLGVTGGVAAYKACEVVRLLVTAERDVRVALTPHARQFVGAELFSALSRRPVLLDDPVVDGSYPHLDAARDAAVLAIAPCTANTLAKLALGLADNVVCQSALSTAAPLLVAPAMNVRMWEHPATQAHLATLRERGATIVGPASGALAEGEVGAGRMSEPSEIVDAIERLLAPLAGTLAGRRVLITAGGTREPLDAVRFLGNRSSGRMGVALADLARERGAEVCTVLANALVEPAGGEVVHVETTAELERETLQRAASAEIVLMAAAVADFRPREPVDGKRRRGEGLVLELEPTSDILAQLGAARRPGQVLVGFAAEPGRDLDRARAKRERKQVDLIVLNDISRADIGFDVDHNEVAIIGADDVTMVERASKRIVAAAILDRVEQLLA